MNTIAKISLLFVLILSLGLLLTAKNVKKYLDQDELYPVQKVNTELPEVKQI